MQIIRVFPRKTNATPTDALAFVGDPPLFRPDADEVHVSCTFTWDKPEAERLVRAWSAHYPTRRLGGPAYDDAGGEFVPGRYVKDGMTITSRGCPNACGFCFVPKREGRLRLLEIKPGWDILDNNILACPREHIEAVLAMLDEQPKAARFTGGIEARRVEPWFVERLKRLRLEVLFMAYDQVWEKRFVERAAKMMVDAGLTRHQVGCYVLCGFYGDTIEAATQRCEWVKGLGVTPFAMYFQDTIPRPIPFAWRVFRRDWSRPALIWSAKRVHVN